MRGHEVACIPPTRLLLRPRLGDDVARPTKLPWAQRLGENAPLQPEYVSRKQFGIFVGFDRQRLAILDANDRQTARLDHAVRISDQSRHYELSFHQKALVRLELAADLVKVDPGLLQFSCQARVSFAFQ